MIWEAGSEIGQLPASIETLDATGEFDLFFQRQGKKQKSNSVYDEYGLWIVQIGISIWFEMFVHWPLAV